MKAGPASPAARDRGTFVASIVLLGALAAGSYWLAERARMSDPIVRAPGHDIGYTADKITLTRMDDKGRAQYVVDADRLIHYADDDSGELTQPRMAGSKADRPEMKVRADLGKSSADGQEMRLYGDVVMHRAPWRGAVGMVASGPYMLVRPEEEKLESDQPVVVVQGGSRIDAGGMRYDNADHKLDLDGRAMGQIKVVIEPRAARAAGKGRS